MREAWIIDGARSPRGKGKANGSLHDIHPQELLAQVLNALAARVGFDPEDVDDVVVGNGIGDGDHGVCIGRMAVLAAGWPVEAPGITLNRFCGSGQQAVTFAAMGIQAGSPGPRRRRWSQSRCRAGRQAGPPDFTAGNAQLRERFPLVPQGISADLIATIEGFARDDVDAFAVQSQERAAVAQTEGRFDRSVVPIHNDDGSVALDRDEYPRPGTTLEGLAKLTPSFEEMGRRRSRASTARSTRCASRRTRRSTTSSTCTTPATRRVSSTAPARSCSRRPTSRRPTGSRRGRAS